MNERETAVLNGLLRLNAMSAYPLQTGQIMEMAKFMAEALDDETPMAIRNAFAEWTQKNSVFPELPSLRDIIDNQRRRPKPSEAAIESSNERPSIPGIANLFVKARREKWPPAKFAEGINTMNKHYARCMREGKVWPRTCEELDALVDKIFGVPVELPEEPKHVRRSA